MTTPLTQSDLISIERLVRCRLAALWRRNSVATEEEKELTLQLLLRIRSNIGSDILPRPFEGDIIIQRFI